MRYRGFEIEYNPKPVSTHRYDWTYRHPDIENCGGFAASEAECRKDIDEMQDECDHELVDGWCCQCGWRK